jgi:hypothetical protein
MPRFNERSRSGYRGARAPRRGRGRHTPYPGRASRFNIETPDVYDYSKLIPRENPDKARMVEAKKRERICLEGLRQLDSNFTWNPNTPQLPGSIEETALRTTLEELSREYKDRVVTAVSDHYNSHLANNRAILEEMEARHNIVAPEASSYQPPVSESRIMANVGKLMTAQFQELKALLKGEVDEEH